MKSGKWLALSFGGGSFAFRNSARRFRFTANRTRWFEEVRVFDDVSLEREYPDFVRKHRKALIKRTKGYGYFIWKSFLVAEMIRSLPLGYDGVAWIDSGCALNVTPESTNRMRQYFSMATEHETMSFSLPHHYDSHYTKADVWRAVGLTDEQVASPQVISGAVFFGANETALRLASEWHELACADGYRFSDDSPSTAVELTDFIAHRWDQSIWSMVAKRSGSFVLDHDETFFAPNWQVDGRDYPIWALRQRTGTPPLSNGVFWDAVRRLEALRD
jgi:hypothetical protein